MHILTRHTQPAKLCLQLALQRLRSTEIPVRPGRERPRAREDRLGRHSVALGRKIVPLAQPFALAVHIGELVAENDILDRLRRVVQVDEWAHGCASGTIFRSEEHTSELQSLTNLVCRLLLDTKNTPH